MNQCKYEDSKVITCIVKGSLSGEVEYIYLNNIIYIGDLLSDNEIKNLKYYGNVAIDEKMVQQLPEAIILSEVNRITGLPCKLVRETSGYVLQVRNKKLTGQYIDQLKVVNVESNK